MPRVAPWPMSRRGIAIAPLIMSSPAGWPGPKAIRAEQERISPPPWSRNRKTIFTSLTSLSFAFAPPTGGKWQCPRRLSNDLSKVTGFRAGALRALLGDAIQRNDFARAEKLAQELQMSEQVRFTDYLLCLDFYRKLDEKKFAALLEKIKSVAARNPTDVALLMDWMNSNGMSAEVLKWMDKSPLPIITNPPPAIAIAEAFTDLKNWSRLKRWTRSGSWESADYLRLAYQAYGSRQARQAAADAEFETLWQSAEKAAGEQHDRETNLARLATKWNLTSEAEQLWLRLAKYPPARREALDNLFRIYRAANNVRKLLDIARQIHNNSPDDAVAKAPSAGSSSCLNQTPRRAANWPRKPTIKCRRHVPAPSPTPFHFTNRGAPRKARSHQTIGLGANARSARRRLHRRSLARRKSNRCREGIS